jgi:hypothetical protein
MTTTWSTSSSATAPGNSSGNAWALSNSNLTSSKTPGGVSANSSTGALSGLKYWEVTMTAIGSDGITGIVKSGDTLNNFLGQSANGYGYSSTGYVYNNNVNISSVTSYVAGDIIGIAYDATNGNLWFSKNGVWKNSATIAEIAAGTTTHAIVTGLSGTFYAALSNGAGSGTAITGTLRPNSTGLTYAVPSGYTPLDTVAVSFTAAVLAYTYTLILAIAGRIFKPTFSSLAYTYTLVNANRNINAKMGTVSYVYTLIAATITKAMHIVSAPLAYVYTLVNANRVIKANAAVYSYVYTLLTLIEADFPAPANKFLIRLSNYVLSQIRVTAPTLGQ